MNTISERLWTRYVTAKLAALRAPTPANVLREREYLAAFARAFPGADEGETA